MRARHRSRPASIVALFLAAFFLSPAAHAQRGVKLVEPKEDRSLLPCGPAAWCVIVSPDNQHSVWIEDTLYAAGLKREKPPDPAHQFRPIVDGIAWQAYETVSENSFLFSPDSKHLAFAARKQGKWLAVLDGVEGKPYRKIATGDMLFDPASQRLAYAAQTDDGWVVVNGNDESRVYDEIPPNRMAFGGDGKRLAFIARGKNVWRVTINGEEGPPYENIGNAPPLFTPDGAAVTYVASRGGKSFVVAAGRDQATYDAVEAQSLRYSFDGRRLAYVARSNGKSCLVNDGAIGKAYDAILAPTAFSPDSRHVAFVARVGKKLLVVTSGPNEPEKELGPYDTVPNRPPLFDPTGRRLAFVAGRVVERPAGEAVEWSVIIDGQESERYILAPGPPVFSPDGRHVAYVADGRVYVDGLPSRLQYRAVRGRPVFDANGSHIVYTAMDLESKHDELAWNGPEGQRRKILFDSPATFKDNRIEFIRVTEKIVEE